MLLPLFHHVVCYQMQEQILLATELYTADGSWKCGRLPFHRQATLRFDEHPSLVLRVVFSIWYPILELDIRTNLQPRCSLSRSNLRQETGDPPTSNRTENVPSIMAKSGSSSKQQQQPADRHHNDDDDDDHRKLTQEEQPLQAVLLADDWKTPNDWGFQPLVLDHRPKLLSPLLDRPLIEYTIRYLATQQVDQVVIVCATCVVADYVTASIDGWRQQWKLECSVVHDSTVANAGDALRELDKRSWLLGAERPFVLLHGGDIITNVALGPILQAHRERHQADPTVLMTLVVQEKETPTTTTTMNDLILGVDPHQSNRILLYQSNTAVEASEISVPCSFFTSHCTELQIYSNHTIVDVGLDICSPEVLLKFSDEFDYRHIRSQFVVNAVAEEEEGLVRRMILPFSYGGVVELAHAVFSVPGHSNSLLPHSFTHTTAKQTLRTFSHKPYRLHWSGLYRQCRLSPSLPRRIATSSLSGRRANGCTKETLHARPPRR